MLRPSPSLSSPPGVCRNSDSGLYNNVHSLIAKLRIRSRVRSFCRAKSPNQIKVVIRFRTAVSETPNPAAMAKIALMMILLHIPSFSSLPSLPLNDYGGDLLANPFAPKRGEHVCDVLGDLRDELDATHDSQSRTVCNMSHASTSYAPSSTTPVHITNGVSDSPRSSTQRKEQKHFSVSSQYLKVVFRVLRRARFGTFSHNIALPLLPLENTGTVLCYQLLVIRSEALNARRFISFRVKVAGVELYNVDTVNNTIEPKQLHTNRFDVLQHFTILVVEKHRIQGRIGLVPRVE